MSESGSQYFENVKETVQSFWQGLSITLSYLMRRPITTQYPDRTELPVRDTLPPRYRGFLEVDASICTGCQACERACPIGCIQITLEKDAANPKQRIVSQFDIDEAKCMFCGLCVEPCPTGSIQHTREFEGTQRSVRNLTFRWADPEMPFPVFKVQKGAEYYPRAPLGTLVRAKIDERRWDAPGPEYLPPEPPGAATAAAPKAKAAAPKPAAAAPVPKPAVAAPAAKTAAAPVAATSADPTAATSAAATPLAATSATAIASPAPGLASPATPTPTAPRRDPFPAAGESEVKKAAPKTTDGGPKA
jgi:NADH-quinone oxidoreductase subunit I